MITVAPLDLLGDDIVTFPHCVVRNGQAVHNPTGVVLPLNVAGARIIELCNGSRTWNEAINDFRASISVDAVTASSDVYDFVTAAERRGLVRVRRNWRSRAHPATLLILLTDLVRLQPRRLERRSYPPTPRGLTVATLWACRLPVALALWFGPFMFVGILTQDRSPVVALLAALAPLAGVLVIAMTIAAHEAGHLWAMAAGIRARTTVEADTLTVRLRQLDGCPVPDALVALLGPLLGLAVGASISESLVLGTVLPNTFAMLPLAVGVAHLASLTPWAHDGRVLFARWRKLRATP